MEFIGIGFIEIMVILIVTLLVVAPDLPEYAHKLGRIIRNFIK